MSSRLPVNLEFVLSLVNVNHFQPRRRKTSWLSVFMFQVSPVWELLRAVLCLGQPVWLAGSVSGCVCEPQGPVQQRSPSPRAAGGGGHVKHPVTCSTKETKKQHLPLEICLGGSSAPTHREFILLVPNPCALSLLNNCLDID